MRSILIVLTIVLAGCSDSPSSTVDDDPFSDLDTEPVASDKGLIRGLVIDDAIVPVVGATITLVGQGKETTSNENGAFVFNNLDPATYFLEISRPGFATVQQSADVVAGVATPDIVKILLQRLPGTEPYFLQAQYTGWIACEYQYAFFLGSCDQGTGLFGDPDSAVYFPIDSREPEWVQMEVTWEHTQDFGKSLTMTMGACGEEYCSPYGFGDNNLCQTWSPKILWCKVGTEESTRSGYGSNYLLNETGLGSSGPAGIAIDMSADCSACTPPETPICGASCGVGLILEQTFDAYLHVFYNWEPPNKEWFFLVDGAHPEPPS